MKTLLTNNKVMTGNINVQVQQSATTYNITPNVTNITVSPDSAIAVRQGESATFSLKAATGYSLPSNINIGGYLIEPGIQASIPWCVVLYTKSTETTGALVISHIHDNLTFIASGEPLTELCFTANKANSTVELVKVGTPSITNTAYSYDRVTWTTFTPSETAGTNVIRLAHAGDTVYFRNDITANLSYSDHLQFLMTGSIRAGGNCNSMYISTEFNALTSLRYYWCYQRLFADCAVLTKTPVLPALSLSYACYKSMFDGCTSLATVSELPAIELGSRCYEQMFYNCTSLIIPSELPAMVLVSGCYWEMFYGCTSLTVVSGLPATTLAEYCYYGMFFDCTSLTSAPELPAISLETGCYLRMFGNCTSLTTVLELPATTLAEDCYNQMFSDCSSLIAAPALPATTLAPRCYSHMFSGCNMLETCPALPSTLLAENCYYCMFEACVSLRVSDTQTTEAPYAWRIPRAGTFTNTTTYDQEYMFQNCLGTRSSNTMTGANGESHTYYTQNPPVAVDSYVEGFPFVSGTIIKCSLDNERVTTGNDWRYLNKYLGENLVIPEKTTNPYVTYISYYQPISYRTLASGCIVDKCDLNGVVSDYTFGFTTEGEFSTTEDAARNDWTFGTDGKGKFKPTSITIDPGSYNQAHLGFMSKCKVYATESSTWDEDSWVDITDTIIFERQGGTGRDRYVPLPVTVSIPEEKQKYYKYFWVRDIMGMQGVDYSGETPVLNNNYCRTIGSFRMNGYWKPDSCGEDFTELEYIESDGTQITGVNYIPNQNTKVVLDATILGNQTSSWPCLFGSGVDDGTSKVEFGLGFNKDTFDIIGMSYGSQEGGISVSSLLNQRCLFSYDKNKLYINNIEVKGEGNQDPPFETEEYNARLPLTINGWRDRTGALLYSKLRIYSAKIYENDVLVRDLVPAKEHIYNSAGLYDKKQKLFRYINNVYTAGPEKSI